MACTWVEAEVAPLLPHMEGFPQALPQVGASSHMAVRTPQEAGRTLQVAGRTLQAVGSLPRAAS